MGWSVEIAANHRRFVRNYGYDGVSYMTDLYLHGRKVDTVFDLLGKRENDITCSLGWALSRSQRLAAALLADFFPGRPVGSTGEIRLQNYGGEGGYTDIELVTEEVAAVIEAKRGWTLPEQSQLERYTPRLQSQSSVAAVVVITECSFEYAALHLPSTVSGVPVKHRSWRDIAALVSANIRDASNAEKRLLAELHRYLRGLMSMQNQDSNMVYVVSVTGGADWSTIPPTDYIDRLGIYFHPFGVSGWPKEPPNYLAFRYGGKLRSIHHVAGYRIVPGDLHEVVPEVRPSEGKPQPHILYDLGPAIRPSEEVRTGNILSLRQSLGGARSAADMQHNR